MRGGLRSSFLLFCLSLAFADVAIGAGDVIMGIRTRFTNTGSIANTRHNLTQSTLPLGGTVMGPYRNDYRQVCVYCHTPHGANTAVEAPLWNRKGATAATAFTKYTSLTLQGSVSDPGGASMSCLSCHDGVTSVDAILNMPGSGRYNANPDAAFLDTWDESFSGLNNHAALNNGTQQCLSCHQPNGQGGNAGSFDFRVANIGTDLRNDHPIGVAFPGGDPDTTGFQTGFVTTGGVTYYDVDGNGSLSKSDPRTYGGKIECASCHDPHGVPSAGVGTTFLPTFLRVTANGSQICLTCHAK